MKNLFSQSILCLALFGILGANAQIDYGTIKLYNSLTDQEILSISDGSTYNLNIVGDSLNIVAQPLEPTSVSSVVFTTSIGENNIENIEPYAFKKDDGTDGYYSWLTLSNYLDTSITFTVAYWSDNGGTGTLIGDDVFTITFTKPAPDTQNPTPPILTSTSHTDTTADLSWSGASDNIGVIGYKIFKDGTLENTIGNVSTYQVTGLTASNTYSFTIKALDLAANESTPSNSVSVTTSVGSGSTGSSIWSESGSTASYGGEVAIGSGTVPSGYKLAVDGKIRAREIRVDQDTWPDYVFTDDYDLQSLEDIEKYIEEKGHLPNIPSAKEIEDNGLELGEMNRLLLEKIEEIHLYIIELNNRILEQRAINQQLLNIINTKE